MKDEKGYAAVIAVMGIALLSWGIYSIYRSVQYGHTYQRWTQECYRLNGAVQESGQGLSDCFVNGKPCQVNGFQQYETTNPNPYFDNLPVCKEAQQ